MAQPVPIEGETRIASGSPSGTAYALYALGIFTLVNALNLGDRLLLSALQEPIKLEFSLSDLQLGLLGGPSFAILYSLISLPIASLADRRNRIWIISLGLTLWSGLTLVTGLARNFGQLLLCRAGISVGEAAASPAALSIISELFRPERRATAMAVFSIGGPAGALLAGILGGQIAQQHGWRIAFLIFGGAGLLLSALIMLTLREMRPNHDDATHTRYRTIFVTLFRRRSYRHLCYAGILASATTNFITQYKASFLIRVHDLSLSQATLVIGVSVGGAGMIGALAGGFVADLFARRRPAGRTLVASTSFLTAILFYFAAFWAPVAIAIPAFLIASLFMNCYPGISYAAASASAPPSMRAMSVAIFIVSGNLLGYGLGPPLLGAVSDAVASYQLGAVNLSQEFCNAAAAHAACTAARGEGLRLALSLAAALMVMVAINFALSSRYYKRELAGEANA